MKINYSFYSLLFVGLLLTFLYRCEIVKNDETPVVVITSSLTGTTVTCTGKLIVGECSSYSTYGVCWSTNPNPTTADHIITVESDSGRFTISIPDLTPEVTYYFRPYLDYNEQTVYGDQVIVTTNKEEGKAGNVVDIEGNVYHTVKICDQEWMIENLKTTKYSNGTPIQLVKETAAWNALSENDKAYCYYNNNTSNEGDTYGVLYTWPAAMNGKTYSVANPSGVQGVCPDGWHIPSYAEWDELTKCLGGQLVAGGPMKEAGTLHWNTPNKDATNSSGFTALPGGYRNEDGVFRDIRSSGMWWSTTENCFPCYPGNWWTHKEWGAFYHGGANNPDKGLSVRCVKD